MNKDELRLACLELAVSSTRGKDEQIALAKVYVEFCTEEGVAPAPKRGRPFKNTENLDASV